MRISKDQAIKTIINYQWKQAVNNRDSACTSEVRAYYQGCIDTCNEMMVSLGYSRFDSSDEKMVSRRSFRPAYALDFTVKDWENIPSSVYN